MKNSALRALVIVIVFTFALGSLGMSNAQRRRGAQARRAQPQREPCGNTDVSADRALALLMAGNRDRWRGTMNTRNWETERTNTATCQKPFAVIVSCMDSRVPPELVFDQGLGDVFVIRVAGPVLNSDALASLEYALAVKNVKLVIVLGHTDCGAVKGAVDRAGGRYLPGLLHKIEPAITYVSDRYNSGVRIDSKNVTNLNRVSIANARLAIPGIPTFGQSGVRVKWGLYYTRSGMVAIDPGDVTP